MERILIIIILLPYLISPNTTQKKPDREKDGLVGAVHILRTEVAPLVKQGGRYVEKLRMPWMPAKTYDKDGGLLEEIIYAPDGSVSYKNVYTRGANGNETSVAEYDAEGHLLRKSVTVYDKGGNAVEASRYERDGTLSDRTTYTYDSQGRKTYYQGKLISKKTVTREANGNTVEVVEPVGAVYGARVINTYDSGGNLVDSATYHIPDGAFISRTGTPRDDAGNLLAVIGYNADGSEYGRHTLAYDNKGNRVEVSYYDRSGSLTGRETYGREFDSRGNWIKETMSVCDARAKPVVCEPAVISYRKITYY